MATIPFGEYAPDRSPFDANCSDNIVNVMPIVGGWGPFASFIPLTDPLPDRPRGSYLTYVSNGNYALFAGTETALYKFNGTTLSWDDVSKVGGYTTTGMWSMAQFGDMLICTNGIDPPQWIDVAVGLTFADLGGNPPTAKLVGTLGDFVFLSQTSESQRGVAWSGLNNPHFWTPRQKSSDFQVFPDGGEIISYTGGTDGCMIFSAESVRMGQLALDTPLVIRFTQTITNHGCMAPRGAVATGGGVFYLSDDGFYKYSIPPVGISATRCSNAFLDDIERAEIYNVWATEDPNRPVIYFAYRSLANTVDNSYDKVLLYDYAQDRWGLLKLPRIMTGLVDAATPGFTLDGLTALGYTMETLPYSLDSRAWSGGTPSIAAFDEDFRLGFFSGPPMEAVLQTVENNQGGQGGPRTDTFGFKPLVDASDIRGRVSVKDYAGAAPQWKDEYQMSTRTGMIPARASGQYTRFEITIPSQPWTAAHGIDPTVGEEGEG